MQQKIAILGKKKGGWESKELNSNEVFRRLFMFFKGRLKIVGVCSSAGSSVTKIGVLCDQILDSAIVAGITGVSAYIYAGQAAGFKAAVLSFLLTFLVKMKEYRKIS